ncbi:macro domain-containing protein in non 5'region [Arthrobacter sp. Hiyo4]|nr:macro domain-containing protein in non 5'region [Arthrobacter sp. Hiyo4]
MRITILQGDITTRTVDAIVNAANSSLLGGGGVDGAIHRAAGPELLAACRELRETDLPHGLAPGAAVATPGFRLPVRWVIHTVGPNRHVGQTNPALLVSCFSESLRLADSLGAASIALPAVGGECTAGTGARSRRPRTTPSPGLVPHIRPARSSWRSLCCSAPRWSRHSSRCSISARFEQPR